MNPITPEQTAKALDEPIYYPQNEEVDYSDEQCPNCGHDAFCSTCSDCGGEGFHDVYDLDPLWYDEGDTEPCNLCDGHGCHRWCPRCGWDLNLPAKYNTAYHRMRAIVKYSSAMASQI